MSCQRGLPLCLATALLLLHGPVAVVGQDDHPEADCSTDEDKPVWWKPWTWDDWEEFGDCILNEMRGGCRRGTIHEVGDETHFHCEERAS